MHCTSSCFKDHSKWDKKHFLVPNVLRDFWKECKIIGLGETPHCFRPRGHLFKVSRSTVVRRLQVHSTAITMTHTLKAQKMRKLNKKSIKANFSPMSNNSWLPQSMKVDGRKCINWVTILFYLHHIQISLVHLIPLPTVSQKGGYKLFSFGGNCKSLSGFC